MFTCVFTRVYVPTDKYARTFFATTWDQCLLTGNDTLDQRTREIEGLFLTIMG